MASAASGVASMSRAASRAGVIGSADVEPGSAEIGEGEEVAAVGLGGMKAEWTVRAGEEERGHLGLAGRVDHLFAGVDQRQRDAELFAHLAVGRSGVVLAGGDVAGGGCAVAAGEEIFAGGAALKQQSPI